MNSAFPISGRSARQPSLAETDVSTFSMGTVNPEFTGCKQVADGFERGSRRLPNHPSATGDGHL